MGVRACVCVLGHSLHMECVVCLAGARGVCVVGHPQCSQQEPGRRWVCVVGHVCDFGGGSNKGMGGGVKGMLCSVSFDSHWVSRALWLLTCEPQPASTRHSVAVGRGRGTACEQPGPCQAQQAEAEC